MAMDGVGVRADSGPRVTAPGIPRVLAALARAPFVEDERGRDGVHPHPGPLPSRERGWIPAFAGMTGGATVRRLRR